MNEAKTSRLREKLLSSAIFVLLLWQMYQSTKVATTPRGTPAREALQNAHYSLGLVLLVLVIWRLWVWWRSPRPARPAGVPYSADVFARSMCLMFLLTVLGFALTGPFFAWSHGHELEWFGLIPLPSLIGPSYRVETFLGYTHSAIGFWIFFLLALSIIVAVYQRIRYKAPLLRMLPWSNWSGSKPLATEPNVYPIGMRVVHVAVVLVLLGLAARQPFNVFGIVPFTIAADEALVEAGPPPAVDPYADVGAPPELTGQVEQDFMWCRFCHSFEAGGPHQVGPNLHRVFGRPAASGQGFNYSQAFVEAGRNGLIWNDETVDALIADPEAFLDGRHRMRYKPITDAEARKQIVAALKAATK